MYETNGKGALNISFKLAVIGGIEGKLAGLIVGVDFGSVISAKPMQFSKTSSVTRLFTNTKNLVQDWLNGKVKTSIQNIAVVVLMTPLAWFISFMYVTMYYYLLPFVPLTFVVLESYYGRHSPTLPAPAEAT